MGFDLCPGRNILHFFTFLSSDPEVQEEDQEVQEDVLEVHEEDQEADHVVANHDQDPKVAELAVLQATAHAKSKFRDTIGFLSKFSTCEFFKKFGNKFLFLDQSKNEDLDHQKDAKDQGLYLLGKKYWSYYRAKVFKSVETITITSFLDPDQLVLQSQLPQNLDPEADPKNVFHCLP